MCVLKICPASQTAVYMIAWIYRFPNSVYWLSYDWIFYDPVILSKVQVRARPSRDNCYSKDQTCWEKFTIFTVLGFTALFSHVPMLTIGFHGIVKPATGPLVAYAVIVHEKCTLKNLQNQQHFARFHNLHEKWMKQSTGKIVRKSCCEQVRKDSKKHWFQVRKISGPGLYKMVRMMLSLSSAALFSHLPSILFHTEAIISLAC